MKATVTGGAGFIGHHIVEGLLARGHAVRIIDDLSSGRRERLAALGDRVDVVEGSILDPAALDAALTGCEVVFHLAAIASVVRSLESPALINAVNVSGTIEVMLAARRQGVRRVVLAGSSAVYGTPADLPCTERHLPAPTSPYGASKLAAEHYLHTLGRLHGVETVALRYFNVYGPGQDPAAEYAAVVPRFITAALEGRRPVINGSGDISRDFIHVDDAIEATITAADPTSKSGLTCNIASGAEITLEELLVAVGAAAGDALDPVIGPSRPGDISRSVADISLARQVIGFAPRVPLDAGIASTLAWYRDHGVGVGDLPSRHDQVTR